MSTQSSERRAAVADTAPLGGWEGVWLETGSFDRRHADRFLEAHRAGYRAACASCEAAGRKHWNRADFDAAVRAYDEIVGERTGGPSWPAESKRSIRVGDKVICIDDRSSFRRLREDDVYTVEAAYDGSPTVIVQNAYHCLERFRLINDSGEQVR